ncbi:MAG: SCO family protein [Actinomycetota bacterium]
MPRKAFFSTVVSAVMITAAVVCIFSGPDAVASGPRWGAGYFPNVPLITQDGKTVHFYDDLLKGKTVAIDLIYTHCVDSCPLETARLAQAQKLLGDRVGKDIYFYSITIDPKRDTPAVLKAYAKQYHAGPGWLFLTGKASDIDLISKKLGLYSDPDPDNRDGHTTQLMVGNVPTGQWMLNSATEDPHFLATQLETYISGWKKHSKLGTKSYAEASVMKVKARGQYLFATRCVACHTIGHGVRIGPDLLGVTNIRDHTWLTKFIQKPDEMIAAKDPIAVDLYKKYKHVEMPNVNLGPQDVQYLIQYIEKVTNEEQKPPADATTTSAVQTKANPGAQN